MKESYKKYFHEKKQYSLRTDLLLFMAILHDKQLLHHVSLNSISHYSF
ncbi:hypothetical protein HMPREF6123_0873 [Oribacterium sinus F0268]|uniref:Uncharacterized protein n=1 Tax=Oribacterium sinus F0268 TaxID=585501 RepID=C2KWK4_9FIRM|nr:hypothetical protein HMPREF6123_0873 [Oribacterium sinus F0268]